MTCEHLKERLLKEIKERCYLGDGLYAHYDGYHIVLSAEREEGVSWVGLEPEVLKSFDEYRERLYALIKFYQEPKT